VIDERWGFVPNTNHQLAASTWGEVAKVPPDHPIDKLHLLPRLKPYDLSKHGPRALYVRATLNGKKKRWTVGSIIARTFLGSPPSSKHQAFHIDGDYTNNFLSNLEWKIPGKGNAILTDSQAEDIRALYALGQHTQQTIANAYNVNRHVINCILNNRTHAPCETSATT